MMKIGIVCRFVSRNQTVFLFLTVCILVVILAHSYRQRQQCPTDIPRSSNSYMRFNDIASFSMGEVSSSYESLVDMIAETAPKHNRSAIPLCPEQPSYIVGQMNITPTVTLREVTKGNSLTNLSFGGRYAPSKCNARERTAIIIPYRDRKKHLEICVRHLHAVLQRQELEYGIYVVEMALPTQFNRGLLANAGVRTVQGIFDYTCYIIHDVDMLMTDDRNLYRCGSQPVHYVTLSTKHGNNSISYDDYYGAVVGFTKEQYKKCNGFSNLYFGWGGEDDDLGIRVSSAGMKFVRPKKEIGKYVALLHDEDVSNQQNPNRFALLRHAKARWIEDGVDSIKFTRLSLEYRKLYTWILIGVEEDAIVMKYQKYLEDMTSGAEEITRLSTIKPWKSSSRFDLDRSTPDLLRRALADPTNNLFNIIKDAKKEFRDDVASHTWSTFKIIRNTKGVYKGVDATMNDQRAKKIIKYINDRKYFFFQNKV